MAPRRSTRNQAEDEGAEDAQDEEVQQAEAAEGGQQEGGDNEEDVELKLLETADHDLPPAAQKAFDELEKEVSHDLPDCCIVGNGLRACAAHTHLLPGSSLAHAPSARRRNKTHTSETWCVWRSSARTARSQ